MGSIIKKYGGTIDKFMGDAIMALFGAPESYPDNGNRAANAALEMRKALNTLDIHLVMPPNYTLDIGTGILLSYPMCSCYCLAIICVVKI